MRKQEAVDHFGSQEKVAIALGITRQAVQSWPNAIPLNRALQLRDLTKGKLKVKLDLYRRNGGK